MKFLMVFFLTGKSQNILKRLQPFLSQFFLFHKTSINNIHPGARGIFSHMRFGDLRAVKVKTVMPCTLIESY